MFDNDQWDLEVMDQVCTHYGISRKRFKESYGLYNYYVVRAMNSIKWNTLYKHYTGFFIPGVKRVSIKYDVLEADLNTNKVFNKRFFPEYQKRRSRITRKLNYVRKKLDATYEKNKAILNRKH